MPGLRCLFAILFLLSALWGNAQIKEVRNVNLGVNVTSIFSSLVGNDNSIEVNNFPILIRFGKENLFRLGLGASVKRNDEFDIISLSNRLSEEVRILAKAGYEFSIFQDSRWGAYWGIDGLLKYERDKINSFITGGENTIKEDTYGLGAAAFLGIRFRLSQRIFLTTEAALGGMGNRVRYEQSGFGIPQRVDNSNEFDFTVEPPLFLYLNFAF